MGTGLGGILIIHSLAQSSFLVLLCEFGQMHNDIFQYFTKLLTSLQTLLCSSSCPTQQSANL